MNSRDILKLMVGFKHFREKYYAGEESVYSKLSEGQNPKTLIIACSDSRVDPALLSSASPGELFIVRNIANLVPPFESTDSGHHGVSAAIEFGVVNLKVENLVVLGHRQCGGIRALMSGEHKKEKSFVGKWMKIMHQARESVMQKFAKEDFETQCRECEMEAIAVSITNLKSFPFVKEALDNHTLHIYGIYFDLEQGNLLEFDEATHTFQALPIGKPAKASDDSHAINFAEGHLNN